MRIPIILAVVALVLSGCNANQAINPSGQANRCANDPSCNPYNPSSYAQNNVGIGGGEEPPLDRRTPPTTPRGRIDQFGFSWAAPFRRGNPCL